jgi:hypothetical protein
VTNRRAVAGLLPLIALVGCLESPKQCVCTLQFVSIRFLAVNSSGLPVPGVVASVQLLRTHEMLDVPQSGLHAGVITVIDDSFISRLARSGDTVRVTGSKDTLGFVVDFVIGVDACACHVIKLAGPDMVILR